LFGANSAGKSTVIRALHYAREILERHNFNPDDSIYGSEGMNLGGFKSLVHGHDYQHNAIQLRFDINVKGIDLTDINRITSDPEYEYHKSIWIKHLEKEANTAWLTIKIQWSSLKNKPIITLYETGFNDDLIARITPCRTLDDAQYEISYINFNHLFLNIEDGSIYFEKRDQGRIRANPRFRNMKLYDELKNETTLGIEKDNGIVQMPLIGQSSGIPSFNTGTSFDYRDFDMAEGGPDAWDAIDSYCEFFNKILVVPGLLLKNTLNQLRYIGPIREIPQRTFTPNKIDNEKRWNNGLGAWDLLYKSPKDFLEKVNVWMDALKTGYTIKLKLYKELCLDSPLMQFLNQDLPLDNIDPKKEIDELPVNSLVLPDKFVRSRTSFCTRLINKHTL